MVTIIVLLLLSSISINLILGKNGIITTARRAREEMKIAEGKEKIELALVDLYTERETQGFSCDLDYVSQNIDGKVKNTIIEGIKGSPVVKIYISYQDYMFKITQDLQVVPIGNVNIAEEPELEIIRDVTETGVEQVNLTVRASVEEGEISEIVKPDGDVEYVEEITYAVTENGSYTFKAITEKGMIEEKTVTIQSIKIKDAIEIGTTSSSGEETAKCSHIYEMKYDDNNHWKQCILCNNKIEIVAHTIQTEGTDSCANAYSAQIKYCTDECGYKVTLPKKSHSNLSWTASSSNYEHRYLCGICSANTKQERCYDVNGIMLGCDTGNVGTCVICGYNYKNAKHATIRYGKCGVCEKKFYDVSSTYEIIDEMTTKYTWHISNIIEGLSSIKDRYENGSVMQVPAIGCTLYSTNIIENSDGSIDITKILQTNKESQTTKSHIGITLSCNYNGNTIYSVEYCDSHKLVADNYAPTVQSITVEGADSLTEFSRSVTITAKFEETWDSIVEMALYDSDGSVISDWSTASKEGTTFTKVFNVVTETTTQKELTVKAKDRCGNIGEGKVTIGKIDTKAPILVSSTDYNNNWTIGKQIKIEATDEGSGNVQIALGNEADYQLANLDGNKYYRIYNFTGDVYEDVVRIIYLKDAVGNVTTSRITIGKMDTTSPTISNINKNDKTITITANDINTKLNQEGSGISGYAISKSKEVPTDNGFQTSNIFTVEETGTYYIWVKDNAGNLSQTKQIEI